MRTPLTELLASVLRHRNNSSKLVKTLKKNFANQIFHPNISTASNFLQIPPGEEEVEAVDAKVGRSGTRLNKVEVGASVKEGMSAFASGSSHNIFSILTLSILLLVNHRLAL